MTLGLSVLKLKLLQQRLFGILWPGPRHGIQLLHAGQLVCGWDDAGWDPPHRLTGLVLGQVAQVAALQRVHAGGRPSNPVVGAEIGWEAALILVELPRSS